MNINVFTFEDITAVLQSAQDGDSLYFYIKNPVAFTGAVFISKAIAIHLVNGSGNSTVTLTVAGGSYRHFSTATNVHDVSLNVGDGIILDGGGTGGGLNVYGANNLLTLNGCVVTNCVSAGNGGGVLIQGAVSRSRLTMQNTHITACRAGSGGGIFGSDCDIILHNSEISGNRANNSGGGITTIAGANRLGSILTINGGIISGNTTLFGDAGGINAFDTIVTIQNSEISGNAADNYGGGIYAFRQLLTANENRLVIKNSVIKGNRIRNTGGGIGLLGQFSEFVIENCLIAENYASSTTVAGTNQGGGIYFADGSTLALRDGQVTGNKAGKGGGGILVNGSTLLLTGDAEVSNNESELIGGGIYGYYYATVTIGGSARVIHNIAKSGEDPERLYGGGGGIALYASALTVEENATISGNSAVSYGGAIWTYPDFTPVSSVLVQGGMIEENTANYGGAISMGAVAGYTPAFTGTGGKITHNTALKDGGGIIAKGSLVTIAGSEISYNTAGRDGGGIFTDELANVTVYATGVFSGNIAGSYTYWAVTSGGDSDIHLTHIFTGYFSTFIPVQTPQPAVWSFINAYNNYDINYVKPPKSIYVNAHDLSRFIVHSTTINSFLGATVVIPSRESVTDANGTVWLLDPPGQPAQIVELSDPEGDYIVTFHFAAQVNYVIVFEHYVDTEGDPILSPTQTIVEVGGNYTKSAPNIQCYTFVGYKVDEGPLQTGEVMIVGVDKNTTVTFVYAKNPQKPCCPCCCCKRRQCENYLPVTPIESKDCIFSCRCPTALNHR